MRRRRYPYLTREDIAILSELEREDPKMACELERLLEQQWRAEMKWRTNETTGADPAAVVDARRVRAFQTGGGRKRPTYQTAD
jgi:hypothetical protein